MSFPETNPQIVNVAIDLPKSGLASKEVIIMRTPKKGTITDAWAMVNSTAAATSNLTCTIYNRGTGFAGTTEIDVLGGAGTVWGATTPKAATVAHNTAIAANSYISAAVSRIAGSTASAWVMSVGVAFVPGDPAEVADVGA